MKDLTLRKILHALRDNEMVRIATEEGAYWHIVDTAHSVLSQNDDVPSPEYCMLIDREVVDIYYDAHGRKAGKTLAGTYRALDPAFCIIVTGKENGKI